MSVVLAQIFFRKAIFSEKSRGNGNDRREERAAVRIRGLPGHVARYGRMRKARSGEKHRPEQFQLGADRSRVVDR